MHKQKIISYNNITSSLLNEFVQCGIVKIYITDKNMNICSIYHHPNRIQKLCLQIINVTWKHLVEVNNSHHDHLSKMIPCDKCGVFTSSHAIITSMVISNEYGA